MTARVVVAGTSSGVGKTTVATGLMAALAARGLRVTGFKAGPDFVDPSYHQLATGRPSRNLDVFMSGAELIAPLFAHGAAGADVAVVEGVMGMFDGVGSTTETASTAHIAKLLDTPVILVVDAGAMARSVAAMVHGYATFDPDVRVAGVIANFVGSEGHAQLVREALAPLGIPLLGTLLRDPGLVTPSRHLGLVPVAERTSEAARTVADLGGRVAAAVDLDAVLALGGSAPHLTAEPWDPTTEQRHTARIAVAGGPAFSFVYPENLELLTAAGTELLPLNPTTDEGLPDGTDALYLGGGFPEMHGEALAANVPLRQAVAELAAAGRPVLAECGGLLYLCRSLDGRPMCGVLDADAHLTERLTLGYRTAEALAASWYTPAGTTVRGHEFHYSTVEPGAGDVGAWRLKAATGKAVGVDGFARGGVHASYLHTHWAARPELAHRFVAAAAEEVAPCG
ncbi:MAG: cobyrinate a,c-diamide synthase [Egibacteraceae bacterium]